MTEHHPKPAPATSLPVQWIEEEGFELALAIRPPGEWMDRNMPPCPLLTDTRFLPLRPPQP